MTYDRGKQQAGLAIGRKRLNQNQESDNREKKRKRVDSQLSMAEKMPNQKEIVPSSKLEPDRKG